MTTKSAFPVVILAGGLATRLRPLTTTIPKALIEINSEPFIVHQLKLLRQNGIQKVVLCVGYLGEQLQEYLGDGSRFNLEILYSYDGEKLLGTAGAIKQALPLLADNFFVMYGDSYLPCDFSAVQASFIQQNKPALMTVFFNQGQWDTSNVEYSEQKIQCYDKKNRTERMHHIDYGLGVFAQSAFAHLATDVNHDLADLYQKLLQQNQLAACEIKERFYEIGSFAGIEELRYYLAE